MATREPELYKDKVEVSLDGRQIFYLFFGGAVLVGLVFVLGVMVGRRVESRSHVDGLSRLDPSRGASDPLAALDGLENRKLSFQEALTKGEPKTPVEHQIDELAKKPEAKAEAAKVEPEKKPEKIEKKDDKKVEKKDDKKKKADAPSEPVTKPEQLSALPKPEKAEPKPAPKKPAPVIEEPRVNADVVTAPEPKPKTDKPVDKLAEAKGKFTLQLSSFQDRHEADTFLSKVVAQGYQAYVTEAEVSGKGVFYRVRMGSYRSLEAANDAKADVEKAIKKSASVMRL